MTAGELISRLDGVRETGAGRWLARCPAHDDRSPSLSIRECDDGTILLHDFGGCSALEVVESIGLEFADLFPTREIRRVDRRARGVPRLSAAERLELIEHEVTVAALLADEIARMRSATDEQAHRLALAAGRIGRARHA
ncbi:MAG TPA: DNA primase [Gammaproteobacteria bacterium]